MTFEEAAGRLLRCITQDELARRIGVTRNTVARALMDRSSANYRPPPKGWEQAVAALARFHGGDLLTLADELDRTP
jgi:transcriptional regulator with XRE-family HTH domain